MNVVEKVEVIDALTKLAEFKGKDISGEHIKLLVKDLGEYSSREILEAIDRARRTVKRFPDSTDLIEIIEEEYQYRKSTSRDETVPCNNCHGCGYVQVWAFLKGAVPDPECKVEVFPGTAYQEAPKPGMVRMVGKCDCPNRHKVSGLPSFKFSTNVESVICLKDRAVGEKEYDLEELPF